MGLSKLLNHVDRNIRLNKHFPELNALRNILRNRYHWVLNTFGQGAHIRVGGRLPVTIPAEFGSREVEHYEVEAVTAIYEWLAEKPASLFIDIGCSLGYLSCGVLWNAFDVEVIAIDADIHSLAATRRVCSLCKQRSNRLTLMNCFVGPSEMADPHDIEKVEQNTLKRLEDPKITGDPGTTNYVNLDKRSRSIHVPTVTIDQIIGSRTSNRQLLGKACLVKCDIEGAEELMLQGAHQALSRHRVWMLVSVHPQYLHHYNSSKSRISNIFERYGYEVKVLSIDHEEHWMCKPKL